MTTESTSADTDPVAPESFETSQSGLHLLMYRLAAQERAMLRSFGHAKYYLGFSLAILIAHIGIAIIEPNLNNVGVFVTAGMFVLAGSLFTAIHWPGSNYTVANPKDINEGTWSEGRAAVWTWSYTIQEAYEMNRGPLFRYQKINAMLMATAAVEALWFGGITIAHILTGR